MSTGTICRVIAEKAFGFIAIDGEQLDVFFHVNSLPDGLLCNEMLVGRRVSCDIGMTGRGPRASNVQLLESDDG